MNSLGKFLLAKDAHAIIIAFLCALLPIFYFPVGFIAVIIVGFITLQKGPKSGLWILTWVALPSIALLALHRIGIFDLLFLRCVFIWVLASVLYRYKRWGLLLEIIALMGVLFVLTLHYFVPHLQQWWVTELTRYTQQMVLASHWKVTITPQEFADRLSFIATGISVFFCASLLLAELLVARLWQASLFSPGSFAKEFIQIRVGYLAVVLACLLIVLVLCKIPGSVDALPLVALPFFMAGLSLMHFFARQKKQLIYVLIVMYVGLFLLPAFVISILSILAFADTCCNFRKIQNVHTST